MHEQKMNFGGRLLNKFILLLLKALSFYCCPEIYLFSPYFLQGGCICRSVKEQYAVTSIFSSYIES